MAVALSCLAQSVLAQLKINEVHYNTTPAGQFVEIYNTATSNLYLDGLILTDEAGTGIEGIFQFPGSGTDHPITPGEFVVVAVDADGWSPDWECYAGGSDYDNPAVSNLALVGGSLDLVLYANDNIILADGTDLTAPIDPATILDGMNFGGGGAEQAWLSPSAADTDPSVAAPAGLSLNRCPDGSDTDVSSTADFYALPPSPGAANNCGSQPSISIADAIVAETDSGSCTMKFAVTLSQPSAATVTVWYATADGTAVAGQDYVGVPPTALIFPINVMTQIIPVQITGDTNQEPDEAFFVNLSSPTNGTLADAQAVGTLVDDDTVFFIDIARWASSVTCTWSAVSGRAYRVQWTQLPQAGVWSNLVGDVTATGTTASAVDPAATNKWRWYRVLKLY
ncbi:MAG: lamin tail domain-containing protein [Kiritimatiellae bacterium]|nr:lamin tail domain-containing protein [Kiritimatiellia bacterium]